MLDTVMLGRLGEIELSAANIGGQLFFMFMVLMLGLGGGANVMCSQYFGKDDIKSINNVLSITYIVSIILAIVSIIIALFFPKEFMTIFTNDSCVINKGVIYMKISSISFIFFGITMISTSVLRSIQKVKIPVLANVISLIINIILNYILILGKLSFEPMGIKGAAIATVIARICEFIIIIVYICFEKTLSYKIKFIKEINLNIMKKYIKVTTPIFFNELCWTIGSLVITIIVSKMGTSVVAANSINNVIFQLAFLSIQGLSSASSVIIGNTIGSGNLEKTKSYADTILILSIFCGIFASFFIFIMRDTFVNFYNISESTKSIAKDIMTASSIVILFKSLSSNLLFGILRGGGDNKFVLKYEIISLWVFAIPLGLIGTFSLKLSIPFVFTLLKSDEILKGIIGYFRVKKGNWVNDVTV